MHQEDMGQLEPADLPPGSPFRGSDAAEQAEPEPSQPVAQASALCPACLVCQ